MPDETEMPDGIDAWQQFLDAQEQAIPVAVAALTAGDVPSWPRLDPPVGPAPAVALERIRAIRVAVAAVEAAARARQSELLAELAALAPGRARGVIADDPTLGARLDLSG